MGDFQTGKFYEHKINYYLTASYSPNQKSEYGVLKLINHDPKTGKYYVKDSFYFSYPFNKVSFMKMDDEITLIIIGYTGVVGPSQQMLILRDYKLSKPKRSRDIFDNRKITLIQGKADFNVLAFYQKDSNIFVQPGTFVKGKGLEDWSLDFVYQTKEESLIAENINAFYFVDSEEKMTFYYNKKQNQDKFIYIRQYDKLTDKKEEKEVGVALPENYPKFIIENAHCVSKKTTNDCVFLARGSFAIYTSFNKIHTSEHPVATSLLQLTSTQPGIEPYITYNQVIIQHKPEIL